MAYHKSKHIETALKYLHQGKLPQAIAEYQNILKNEPKDQVTLMTLGDLFVRQGETFRGLEYFERLAQIFLNDGFTTKAIAIYKKIAKLAPEESRPLERLAELYIQQGVLSEARPLYLQLAEVQLKAGRQPQAATLLRKLLEAEPENLRVHMRLAELHLAMGQQKEAMETFQGAAQRVLERGDHAEAIRIADRILQIETHNQPALILKARALSGAARGPESASLLESLPEQEAGGEITKLLFEQYLENNQTEKAAALAEKVYAREPKNHALAHHAANILIEAGDLDRAHSLLGLIRNTMIDSGDHESLAQTLSLLAERRPERIETLEWLVDLYGRASDSFRLPDALAQLAQALESTGDDERALQTYEQLLDRSPEDETMRRQYMRLRAKKGMQPISGGIPSPVKLASSETEAKLEPPNPADPVVDDETQRFITQALTDVDLFSSYGLTQKAIDLLEVVLQRIPQHTPTLERLLDLSVGAGNDRRTVELATQLEEIARGRNDRAAVERYAELRRRFQRAAGTPAAEQVPPAGVTQEFAVPTIEAELIEPAAPNSPEPAPAETSFPVPAESAVHEVDLSDEWAALSEQLEAPVGMPGIVPHHAPASANAADQEPQAGPPVAKPAQPASEIPVEIPIEAAIEEPAYDLELQPLTPAIAPADQPQIGDALLAELATEFESAASSLGMPPRSAKPSAPGGEAAPVSNAPVAAMNGNSAAPANNASGDDTAPGPLGDLFEEFRTEMSEIGKEDEDLETHYNLGIAYREMGLLDEAISEFQRVAKANDKAPAFRYAMQCCTLLGLAFAEKGQPAIAAMWYERALLTPGLDQESILALRYDLGVSQELAGETSAAFKSFSQVYAMNIDYRDVAERVAVLGKTR